MVVGANKRRAKRAFPESDPLWYKDAIIYELHVRAFRDSNADGMGDFRGLTEKLDYLQDLGVTALWLLPFYPSPWRDDGYDISDYLTVHPAYGTLRDFQAFLSAAHARGLRVITELVVNHTSDKHPWFQRARRAAPGSPERDFYVWSDTPDKYPDARIIFKDFETSNWSWDPVARAYYWHRFYYHQPDLNFDNLAVRQAIFKALDFWLEMGVDGMRLDAVPYLYERPGTDCENLPETHAFLKVLRAHVDRHYKDRMLLAEANQWPEDAVHYMGNGDECHMAFHFPVMPRLFMALRMEDRSPIVDILEQTPAIPPNGQWALFLRNHDELTLEMVTDSERDYMYRAYAQDGEARINLGIRRRLAPLLSNSRRRVELMNTLLFSLPGTPVLYYGDEIGMGDNVYLGDRNGVRTPLQWSSDRNAGFSEANPQRLFLPVITDPEYHYEALNVETQQNNSSSMLWWTKRVLAMRRRYKVFGRGTIEFLHPENRRILAFLRRYEGQSLLMVANLSRFAQWVELDLTQFRGIQPMELFGGTPFAPIGDHPYVLTLGPHAVYGFVLEPPRGGTAGTADGPNVLPVRADWTEVFEDSARPALQKALTSYLSRARWYSGKARRMRICEIVEMLGAPHAGGQSVVLHLRVTYAEGEPDTYALAVSFAEDDRAAVLRDGSPDAVIARLDFAEPHKQGVLYDACMDESFAAALLDGLTKRRVLRGETGSLEFMRTSRWSAIEKSAAPPWSAKVLKSEQSNTTLVYQDSSGQRHMLLKWFRRLEPGVNPDLEIGRVLTSGRKARAAVPPLIGAVEYKPAKGEAITAAIVHGFVPNEGDAWELTLDALGQYFERVVTGGSEIKELPAIPSRAHLTHVADVPEAALRLIGPYLDLARLLARRTAEMHVALAAVPDNPDFAPESFSDFYRRGLHKDMTGHLTRSLRLLRKQLTSLPELTRHEAARVLEHERALMDVLRLFLERRITARRIRIHGDLHLGQILYTGKDFVIIDFEGEPARTIGERRLKRSALRDVAGMLQSFHYASEAALRGDTPGGVPREADKVLLERAADLWFSSVSAVFVDAYLQDPHVAALHPKTQEERTAMLRAYLVDKAAYELTYELNYRPDWAVIPVRALLKLAQLAPAAEK